jgi:outer membrane protein assembly factor BamD (BamD/ComL family)
MSLKPGQVVLSKYRIEKSLGSGRWGEVYLAQDQSLERKVAVKHLKPEYAEDKEVLARFQREAKRIARLRHPNIAIIYGLEKAEGQSYIILEYAEKGTMEDYLKEESRLSIIEAIDLTSAICSALAAVHRQGILHKDIKPSNILLIQSEGTIQPRLSDFGISYARQEGYFGTAQYTSPEQLQGDRVDTRSDIYSLGIVLYEMLTGRPPFNGSVDEILRGQLEQEPLSLRSFRQEIMPSLENVVLKALSKKPEDRYKTAQEMAMELAAARQEELEKEKKVRDLYAQAVQCMARQNWRMAVKLLEEVCALNPNYEDASQRLQEVQEQLTLETTYEQGLAAFDERDWDKAEERFRRVLNIDANYRNAADKLKEAEQQVRLRSLYFEAGQRADMGDWSEAIQKYAQIIAIDPGYENATEKLADAGEKKQLQNLYAEACALFTEKSWQEAAEKFRQVLALDPHYDDAASKAKEAERHAHSQTLYAEGMEYLSNGQWARAIDTFEKIRRSDPGYEAVDARFEEAKRQKRWQDLFDEGTVRCGRKDWQGAIEKFTQLLSENPQHPAANRLLEEAKKRQTQNAKAKLRKENRIKAWWSPQPPTVKAAWIGFLSALLVALCGLLGSGTAQEMVKRWSTGASLNPTPIYVPTETPTSKPTPTYSPTPTGTPYPTPALVSPDEGTSFAKGQDVKLVWKWGMGLAENEFFQVRIRMQGNQEFDRMNLTKVSYQHVSASKLVQTGRYEWQVAIVSLSEGEKGVSQIWSLEVQ